MWSRRRALGFLLAAGGAGAIAGCSFGRQEPTPIPTEGSASPTPDDSARPAPPPTTAQDARLREQVSREEVELIELHRATIQAHPSLSGQLAEIIEDHLAHLGQVDPAAADALRASASPSTAATTRPPADQPATASEPAGAATAQDPGGPSSSSSGSPSAVPRRRSAAMRELAEREDRAAQDRLAACDAAAEPALARLLCLVGASEAQHASVLRRARARSSTSGGS